MNPNQSKNLIIFSCLSIIILNSCLVFEYDCGLLEARITALNQQVGAYRSDIFNTEISTNFEEAAIQIEVGKLEKLESCDEYAYTLLPQRIESIEIASSKDVHSGGILFPVGENLNSLFKLYNQQTEYRIAEFIAAQNDDPLIFHLDPPSGIVLQLVEKPDELISQPFNVQFSFADEEFLNVEIPLFEVSN